MLFVGVGLYFRRRLSGLLSGPHRSTRGHRHVRNWASQRNNESVSLSTLLVRIGAIERDEKRRERVAAVHEIETNVSPRRQTRAANAYICASRLCLAAKVSPQTAGAQRSHQCSPDAAATSLLLRP